MFEPGLGLERHRRHVAPQRRVGIESARTIDDILATGREGFEFAAQIEPGRVAGAVIEADRPAMAALQRVAQHAVERREPRAGPISTSGWSASTPS